MQIQLVNQWVKRAWVPLQADARCTGDRLADAPCDVLVALGQGGNSQDRERGRRIDLIQSAARICIKRATLSDLNVYV